MDSDDLVVLGRITGAYGIKGSVRVHPYGDDPQAWGRMSSWRVGAENVPREQWQTYTVRRARMHADALVVDLEAISDRDQAEALKGLLVGGLRADLPQPGPDEYYWADLQGLAVRNTEDVLIGVVSGLLETGAHDVLCVQDDAGHEHLIPFVAAYVLAVERDRGLIRVDWAADWCV